MEDKCLCEPTEILIFSCSGGSNVGQIANQAGVKLTQDGIGRFFCLAGIGGHVSGMIESTKGGKMLIAIDGCPVACAKKTLEHTGFNIDEYVEITSMGIARKSVIISAAVKPVAPMGVSYLYRPCPQILTVSPRTVANDIVPPWFGVKKPKPAAISAHTVIIATSQLSAGYCFIFFNSPVRVRSGVIPKHQRPPSH